MQRNTPCVTEHQVGFLAPQSKHSWEEQRRSGGRGERERWGEGGVEGRERGVGGGGGRSREGEGGEGEERRERKRRERKRKEGEEREEEEGGRKRKEREKVARENTELHVQYLV